MVIYLAQLFEKGDYSADTTAAVKGVDIGCCGLGMNIYIYIYIYIYVYIYIYTYIYIYIYLYTMVINSKL